MIRDPRTGKEYGLGRDKRVAVNEAVAANMTMMPATVSLADKISGKEVIFFDQLIDLFKIELKNRGLSEKTAKDNRNKIKHISLAFSGIPLDQITTKEISIFLDNKVSEGKSSYANILRTTLSDMFKTGIRKGITLSNPAADTRVSKSTIEKDRMLLEEYKKIREQSEKLQPWVGLALDLALVTGQRVGDLVKMKWSDIADNKLSVIQSKTKKMLRISLDNKIEILDLSLKYVIEKLKDIASGSEYVLGGRSQKVITDAYREARKASAIEWKNKPAPFHEIRSLSGRLYLKQKNIEFAQNILGHESVEMTLKYVDGRQKEWLEV